MQNSEALNILSDSQDEIDMLQNSEALMTMQDTTIIDVYSNNYKEELKKMAKLTTVFNHISMDTEFPGYTTSAQSNWNIYDEKEYEYQLIKSNVNNSKIIQIGLTLSDEHGRVPQGVCTWQFNFHFRMDFDAINATSKNLLIEAGIDFNKLTEKGINVKEFAQYWFASGIVLNRNIKWIVFHGSYDFAYLLKLVHGDGLPNSCMDFYRLMKLYYPNIYDIKYFIKDLPILKDVGLSKLGAQFGCNRIGPQHQAGSDSLLALRCYFKLKEREHVLKNSNYTNVIYGIGQGFIKSTTYDKIGNNSNMNMVMNMPNNMQGFQNYDQHNNFMQMGQMGQMGQNYYYDQQRYQDYYYYYQAYGYN